MSKASDIAKGVLIGLALGGLYILLVKLITRLLT